MKKLKSTLLFLTLFMSLAVILCFNSSAAEWKELGDISYSIDEDTGVMVVKGDGATIKSHAFGYSFYCNEEDCVQCDGEEDDYTPECYMDARFNTKILIIESGIVALEEGALSLFEDVETIVFPDTVTVIPNGLCLNLRNLKTVVLPYGLTEIKKAAFKNCSALKNMSIPSTVKKIGDYALYNINSEYITIPDTVKSVGEGNKFIPDCIDKIETDLRANSIGLEWKPVKDATHYRVFVRENGKWKKIEDVSAKDIKITGKLYISIENLKSDTKYTFAVRPYNKTYSKPTYWATKYAKVTVKTRMLAEPHFNLTSKSKGKVTIKWKNIENETGYQVW